MVGHRRKGYAVEETASGRSLGCMAATGGAARRATNLRRLGIYPFANLSAFGTRDQAVFSIQYISTRTTRRRSTFNSGTWLSLEAPFQNGADQSHQSAPFRSPGRGLKEFFLKVRA